MVDTRLPEAVKFWNNLESMRIMAQQWVGNDWKHHCEALISNWVGEVENIVDLGCGPGRFAEVLKNQYQDYIGYDGSLEMLTLAKESHPHLEFVNVDIFNFSSDLTYDLAIMIDVAQHQITPLESIKKMMQLWKANRYIFSLVTGEVREELIMTTVESEDDFKKFLGSVNAIKVHREPFDGEPKFNWVLVEVQ